MRSIADVPWSAESPDPRRYNKEQDIAMFGENGADRRSLRRLVLRRVPAPMIEQHCRKRPVASGVPKQCAQFERPALYHDRFRPTGHMVLGPCRERKGHGEREQEHESLRHQILQVCNGLRDRDKPRQGVVASTLELHRRASSIGRNFMTALPEKRDDEEGNTYQRGVPEKKRTQQSISGSCSEQIT